MKSRFKDNVAQPLPGVPMVKVCPRAGVLNPLAYNSVEADKSLTDENIAPGDEMYLLATADVVPGDLAGINTPDGLLVRFIYWFTTPTGEWKLRLEGANPEIVPRVYDYDDDVIRTRWRVVWICRHGDHSHCAAYKQTARMC